jgi:hypothetical protein
MSFNGSGTFVPPAGQPVVTGTVIQSSTFNTLVADIGNTFNNVLPRDGQASMAGQLKLTDGTSSVPGIAFNSEASSGIYRPAAGMMGIVASGVEALRINNAGRVLIGSMVDDTVNRLQVTGPVKVTGALSATSFAGPLTGNVTGNVSGTLTGNVTGNTSGTAANVTGIVALANGGTGQTTAGAALTAIGAVQQGGGVGMGTNKVYLGWGTGGGGGLKVTIDSSDQGFVPFSSTNSLGGGTITFNSPVTALALTGTSGSFSSTLTATGIATLNGGASVQGGQVNSLTSTGYLQTGSAAGANIIQDYNSIQARTTGAASTLYLNNLGGNVAVGSGGITTNGNMTVAGTIYAQSASNLKIALYDSATVRGYIAATSTSCFAAINAANNAYTFTVDNAGNTSSGGGVSATGNVTAKGGYLQAGDTAGQYATIRFDGALYLSTTGSYSTILTPSSLTAAMGYQPLGSGVFGFGPGGLTEVGRYQDWHSASSANDFDVRMDCQAPSAGSGTSVLAVTASAIVCSGNITANSDETLKTNWQLVDDDFLSNLSQVKSGIYDRIDMHETTQMGVSAQSLQKVVPHAVLTNGENGLLSVAYGNVALVASIELSKKVLSLESELLALKKLVKQFLGAT